MVEMVARKARTQVGDSVTSDSKVFLFKPFFCILLTFFLLPLELPFAVFVHAFTKFSFASGSKQMITCFRQNI